MASNDRKCDVRGGISNQIAFEIRELLETPLNEYQDPAWVQATELFAEIVVPCEAYFSKALYDLGVDIAKEAGKRGNRASYQSIPGMYNKRLASGSIGAGSSTRVVDYSKKVESLKTWLSNCEKLFK